MLVRPVHEVYDLRIDELIDDGVERAAPAEHEAGAEEYGGVKSEDQVPRLAPLLFR